MYIHTYAHLYICTSIHITYGSALKNIKLITGPGGLLTTRLVTESGGLATNPPCGKPIEDYSTLHNGPRQGFVTEPATKVCYRGGRGGPQQTPISSHSHICTYKYTWYPTRNPTSFHDALSLLPSMRSRF